MDIDPFGNLESHHRPTEIGRVQDQFRGDDLLSNDLLVSIDILKQQVHGTQALTESGLQSLPPLGRNDPRYHVEREDLFRSTVVGIDRKGNALIEKRKVRISLQTLKAIHTHCLQEINQIMAGLACPTIRGKNAIVEIIPSVILREARDISSGLDV